MGVDGRDGAAVGSSRVEGVDDQAHQLGDLRLERKGLHLCFVRHDECVACSRVCVWFALQGVGDGDRDRGGEQCQVSMHVRAREQIWLTVRAACARASVITNAVRARTHNTLQCMRCGVVGQGRGVPLGMDRVGMRWERRRTPKKGRGWSTVWMLSWKPNSLSAQTNRPKA